MTSKSTGEEAAAVAGSLGASARRILSGQETSFLEGVTGRDELRRLNLLKGPPGRERLTAFARRVSDCIDDA